MANQSQDQFRITTLIFCLVFFLVLSGGHLLAMAARNSNQIHQLQDQITNPKINQQLREQLQANLSNLTHMDFWSVLGSIGDIAFGLDLPTPFAILLTSVNLILGVVIALIIWSFIKAHIPFISG